MYRVKVLHIITGLNTGGAEMMLYKICKYKSENVEYKVISLTTKGPIASKLERLGIEVDSANFSKSPRSILSFFKLLNTIKQYNPDLIQSWMYHSDLVSSIISLILRKPLFWNIRQASVNTKLNKKLTVFVAKLCGKLSFVPLRIISCTKKGISEHSLIGYKKKKMIFIPNGFEISEFTINKRPNQYRKLIHVGRYAPLKNHSSFLRISQMILVKIPNLKIEMYGDGINGQNLELVSLASELGILKNIDFKGRSNNLRDIYAQSDLLISTSFSEGFPNTIGEAMCCGCSVITTNAGDSADIVLDEKNIFLPDQNEEMAIRAVEILQGNINREENRELITSRFDISKTVTQYEILYLNKTL